MLGPLAGGIVADSLGDAFVATVSALAGLLVLALLRTPAPVSPGPKPRQKGLNHAVPGYRPAAGGAKPPPPGFHARRANAGGLGCGAGGRRWPVMSICTVCTPASR